MTIWARCLSKYDDRFEKLSILNSSKTLRYLHFRELLIGENWWWWVDFWHSSNVGAIKSHPAYKFSEELLAAFGSLSKT